MAGFYKKIKNVGGHLILIPILNAILVVMLLRGLDITYFSFIEFIVFLISIKMLLDDSNKRKATESLLIERDRLAVVAEMTANLAHQWKQPLNSVSIALSNIEVSRLLNDNANIDRDIELAIKNISFLDTTVNNFQSFFNKRKKIELIHMKEVIENIVAITYSATSLYRIKMNYLIDDTVENIKVDSSIVHVLLNLVSNSIFAIKDKKTAKEINIEVKRDSQNLILIVEDNGDNPIPQDIINRIFEFRFTTKEKNDGSGLGLHMVKKIIEDVFNGIVFVHSVIDDDKKNKTVFEIRIPFAYNDSISCLV